MKYLKKLLGNVLASAMTFEPKKFANTEKQLELDEAKRQFPGIEMSFSKDTPVTKIYELKHLNNYIII